jgi:hypothetical protein
MDKHDTVGIDCVAMCVNDIVCCGAKPLFFLDYIACGKNVPGAHRGHCRGRRGGLRAGRRALIGGETAEMPGFYPETNTTSRALPSAPWTRAKILDNSTMMPGRRGDRAALLGRALQRLFARAQDVRPRAPRPARYPRPSWAAKPRRGAAGADEDLREAGAGPDGARSRSRACPTSRAAASTRTSRAASKRAVRASKRRTVPDAADLRPARRSSAGSRSATCSTPSTWASA